MQHETLYGKSYVVASIKDGALAGVIQVFELVKFEVGSDLKGESNANARARAKAAAMTAKNAWENILKEDLAVVEVPAGSCDPIVNTGEFKRV